MSVEAEVLLATVVYEAAVVAHRLTRPQTEETEARGRLDLRHLRVTNCLDHLILKTSMLF